VIHIYHPSLYMQIYEIYDDDNDDYYNDGNSTMLFIHHPSFKNLWEYMQTQVLYDVWNV
jgi:hypothetical protein